MKKMRTALSVSVCAAAVLSAVPFSANAAENDTVYGTMNIPYAEFYTAEIGNAYEVDAVSSATASKWAMNEPGKLVAGTFNDGNGTILGVTFPVAVKSSDVAFLTEKYGFAATDATPVAYKTITVNGDSITASKVNDTNGEATADGSAELSTESRYGDYQLNVKGYPEEADLYGVIVNTASGESYALRHLENIWRAGAISWSAGIKTTEAHGNTLKFEDYASSMGKTVTSVTYITLDGYTTVNVGSVYLPVKFDGSVNAEDAAAGTGKTTLTLTGFPEDYNKNISAGEGFTATETEISYTNAMPGSYTVTVSDASGKYADVSGSFILSTSEIPVKYEDGKLVTADGFTDEQAANFIKNITTVSVNETSYAASGKRSVKIIAEDGTIDFEAKSNDANIFDGSGKYAMTVTATGYTEPYSFSTEAEEEPTEPSTEATTATSTATATTTTGSATTTKAPATTKAATTSSKSNSPQTGVGGVAGPAAVLALAGTAVFALRKKND